MGEIIPESWATSRRNDGRLHLGMVGAFSPESAILERFATLSLREQQVIMLVTAGKMNKQVAGDLSLSEVTLTIHGGAAMRKMGACTLADLVRMADAFKAKPS